MDDPYKILEISKDATPQQIKKSYQKLITTFHPSRKTGNVDTYFKIRAAYDSITKKLSFTDQFLKFKTSYLDSDEEYDDLAKLYNKHKGNVKKIIDEHILSEYEDEDRIRGMIEKMFMDRGLKKYKVYDKRVSEKLKKKRNGDMGALVEVMARNEEKRSGLIASLEQKYCNQLKK